MPDYYPNSRGHYAYDQFGVASSFAYRPAPTAQLPMRPTAELGLSELHHAQHHPRQVQQLPPPPPQPQHQLLHQHHQQHQFQPHQQHVQFQSQHQVHQNMANWQTDEDLAEFQELSNKYEPEATVSKHQKPYQQTLSANLLTVNPVVYRALLWASVSRAVL